MRPRTGRRMLLAAVAGAAAALGLAPWGLWPVTLAALLAVPALLLPATSARQAALTGWSLGAGYFAVSLSWIVEPFLVDPDRYAWMAPFALILIAAGGGLFWAAPFAAAQALGRSAAARVWLLIGLWSLAEFARAYLLTGFPWAALAQIWADTDAALLLAWIGPHGLALWTLLALLPPGLALARRAGARALLAASVPGMLLAVAVGAAAWAKPQVRASGAIVRLIQPNAPQHQKWDPDWIPVFFRRQLDFTAAKGPGPRPDLIVWPESAVPVLLNDAQPALDAIAQAAGCVPVVLGIQRVDGARVYNSLVVLDASGTVGDVYDKHHLVPFGEYVPLGDLAARFGLSGFAAQHGDGYSAGPGPRLVELGALGRALPLICYEAVFPQDVNGAPDRPALLLQITNDAWFGLRAGPYQHLAQARMRAIEQGLPMVRVANTGISAMIDPLGRIRGALPLGQAGYLDAPLAAALPPTPYARSGDGPVFLLLLIATFAYWGASGRRNGEK
ncbi:MAG: apolipoprotein N-acyltransferase [Rhodobacteraceae bacterium]|nr:apolipoprotein N-acyltransferase [Paracoccaceae bacterium]